MSNISQHTDDSVFAQGTSIHGHTGKEAQSFFDATFEIFELKNVCHRNRSI